MAQAFSLQSVLSYRIRAVEALELALARWLMTERQTQAELAALRQTEGDLLAELGRRQVGELDLVAIGYIRARLRNVQAEIAAQTARLADVQAQIALKRREIVEAQKAKETLEKLKMRERERWQAEMNRLERAEHDDVYITRAFQRLRE